MRIDLKVGPYCYDTEADRAIVQFDSIGSVPRRFEIVISSAYNAGGLIGPEINGIMIGDVDNRDVVLDQHFIQGSGYFGASVGQRQEFERIRSMDWSAFSAFIKSNPRYRDGSVPDVNDPVPAEGRAPISENVIFPDTAKSAAIGSEIAYPLSTKAEIVRFLGAHAMHREYHGPGYLSWDIKVRRLDNSLESQRKEFNLDPAFDERWEAALDADKEGNFFNQACEDALRVYVEGEFSTPFDVKDGRYALGTAGRSGGHLVLTKMDGTDISATSRAEFMFWLEEDASDDELVGLYKVVASLDHLLANPKEKVEFHLADRRSQLEAEWKLEAEAPAAPAL